MFKKMIYLTGILVCAVALQSCSDDLTKKDKDITVELDSFNLVGSGNGKSARAMVTGNPACTASTTSLNSLLQQSDDFDEISKYLDTLNINNVRYRITQNNTAVAATGSMQMTDAGTGNMTTIASASIPANQLVNDWTALPFVDNGASVIQHYLNNRDAGFLYCAEGSPDSSELDMTMQLQLDLKVTIDLL